MDTSFVIPSIEFLQTLPVEMMAFFTFTVCAISILILFKFFGVSGLYLYNAVIILVANIQVLKTAHYWIAPEPVALGTVAFATSFLATDILTEHYGKSVAQKGVWISISGHILMTVLMVLTLGYTVPGEDKIQGAMMSLFSPSPRILIAGLLALAISQFLDISLFEWIGKKTQGRFLWLRMNVSTLLSGFVDNTIFSLFAWVILSSEPVGFYSLVFTYLLGAYFFRALISLISTPIMYLSYWCLPASKSPILTDHEIAVKRAA